MKTCSTAVQQHVKNSRACESVAALIRALSFSTDNIRALKMAGAVVAAINIMYEHNTTLQPDLVRLALAFRRNDDGECMAGEWLSDDPNDLGIELEQESAIIERLYPQDCAEDYRRRIRADIRRAEALGATQEEEEELQEALEEATAKQEGFATKASRWQQGVRLPKRVFTARAAHFSVQALANLACDREVRAHGLFAFAES